MRTSWPEEVSFVITVAETAHLTTPKGRFTSTTPATRLQEKGRLRFRESLPTALGRLVAKRPTRRSARATRKSTFPNRAPRLGLHTFQSADILTVSRPVRHRRLSGCGRPSSAVPGFEYGLPSPKPRSPSSLAGQSEPPLASSLRFFPPIVVSVLPLYLKFPASRFAKIACIRSRH